MPAPAADTFRSTVDVLGENQGLEVALVTLARATGGRMRNAWTCWPIGDDHARDLAVRLAITTLAERWADA